MNNTPLKLDVDAVVFSKTNGKGLPKPVMAYLKHILHEQTFNDFFRTYPELKDYDFIRQVIGPVLLDTTVSIQNEDKLQTNEPVIFVSNHPLGGLDGMIIALMLAEHRPNKVKVIVNDLLMALKPLHGIFVPVNIVGAQNRQYAQDINQLYLSQDDILTFPSGKCSRKIEGIIQDPQWKKSFIQKAIQYKRNVVPIYFDGQNSRFFYNLSYFRTKLGIKTNIEMLYLADEMFKAKGKHFNVIVGDPIPYQTFDNSKSALDWAQEVRKKVYQLKGK